MNNQRLFERSVFDKDKVVYQQKTSDHIAQHIHNIHHTCICSILHVHNRKKIPQFPHCTVVTQPPI